MRTAERASAYRIAALGMAFTGVACAADPPLEVPNLDELVHAYEHPTAEVDVVAAERIVDSALGTHLAAFLAGRLHFVSEAIDAAAKGFATGQIDLDEDLGLTGKVKVRVICPGSERDRAPDATRNGTVSLQTLIADNAVGPVAFGEAKACIVDLKDVPLPPWVHVSIPEFHPARIDGPVALHVGQLALNRPISIAPIIAIEGTLSIENLLSVDHFDLRLPGGPVVETRVKLPNGTHAVVFADQVEIGVRERRGTWTCEITGAARCLPNF
ncbi:MAG: hypothetical protein ABW133_23545 [Polyangiaceae bacterium]